MQTIKGLIVGGLVLTALVPIARSQTAAVPVIGTGRISGQLVSSSDGQIVRGASVRISCRATTPSEPMLGRSATTDDNGLFAFEQLPVCGYWLTASKTSYLTSSFGQRRPGVGLGAPVHLTDGQKIVNLRFAIGPGGVISGRVLTPLGDPVSRVPIEALVITKVGQGIEARFAADTESNDRGEYRVFGLPPGPYVIRASSPRVESARTRPTSVVGFPVTTCPLEPSVSRTYYPSGQVFAQAASIDLGVSEEQFGRDITIRRPELVAASGRVTGEAAQPTTQVLLVDGPVCQAQATVGANGRFVFGLVPPGLYRLEVRTPAGHGYGDGDGPNKPFPQGPWASESVVAAPQGQEWVVALQAGVPVSGRATAETGAWTPGRKLEVSLRWPVLVGSNPYAAYSQIGSDGTFAFPGVTPGHYSIFASADMSVGGPVSAMANGVDALDFGLDVGPGGVDQFQIIYSRKDSRISGQMTASKTARCFAVAFPRDSRYWLPGARRVKTAAPDLNGAFVFFGLPPGEYLIAASPETGTETPDWPTATTLSALVPFGVSLQLASGGTPRVNLSCR